MKKIVLATAALMSMSSAAFAADILDGTSYSSLSRSEMSAIQGEGGDVVIAQVNTQSNSSTGTAGQVQQANQSIQQIGDDNVAVNSLTQTQTAEITVTPPPAAPKPPTKPEKPKVHKWHWSAKWTK